MLTAYINKQQVVVSLIKGRFLVFPVGRRR